MVFTYRRTAIGCVAAFSSLVLLVVFASYDSLLAALPISVILRPSTEERLKIPSIGVDAAIERVALTPEGAMDTPDGPRNVGWYSLGPYPGEEGSAVIAGHRGWKNGKSAVFDNLDQLRIGDNIVVISAGGEEHTFVVQETRLYGRDSVVPEVFVSDEGRHLRLITCVGTWDPKLKSTDERLVVFAEAVL